MLSHTDGLSDHEVEILWELRGGAHRLEDSEDLGSGEVVGLANTVGVSEVNTDERGLVTLIHELAKVSNKLFLPFLASLAMMSLTSSAEVFCHDGTDRR